MGSDMGELFVQALSEGAVEVIRVKLVIVGKDRVGKTSFKRSVLKQKFDPKEPSTEMVKAELAVCEASNWKELEDKIRDMLDQHIASTVICVSQQKEDSVPTPTTTESKGVTEPVTEPSSKQTDNTNDSSAAESDPEATIASVMEDSGMNTERLKTAMALSEAILDRVKKLQDDPELMKQDLSRLHATVWDLGGQEPLLPGQTQVVTPGSFFLIVFNASERLSDLAKSFHQQSSDSSPVPIQNFWIETNYDAIALWATMVSLARDEHQLVTDPDTTHLPREQKALFPLMFLIGTHAKDVSDEMKMEQNAFLSEMFRNKAFQNHIICPSKQENDWFFCVENSVSDPESDEEDPCVIQIRKLIEELAIQCKRLIPAKWSVLEKILDALQEKVGTALSQFDVIWVFANQLCHISDKRELRAALCYLDEVGSVIFPYRSEKLKNTIVTKPNWLFMVFSIVSSINRPDPKFSGDWDRVRQEGIMSWALTSHRLEEAKVKPSEYKEVLNLLNCFFVLCANPYEVHLPVPYETEYFVPCLLEVQFKGPFAAEIPPDASQPMSLIVCPKNVDFIPEQLHFRLMTCCIEKYPDEPTLKRNYSRYHVARGVYLELIYDSKKYLVVSIGKKTSCHYHLGKLCTEIRQFIHDKLHEVKRPGLCGFQFCWCIQHPGPAIPVDSTKLVCVDGYTPSQDKPLRRNKEDVDLESHEVTALHYWFDQHEETKYEESKV